MEALLGTAASEANPSEQQAQELDFGSVLARGQTLRHEFTLSNPTDRPIRLLRAATSTPCCSAIGPLPKSIPPGGSVQVPISLKTENKLGPLRVGFRVETDSPTAPIRRLAVSARLIPDWEIEAEGETIGSLPIGQPGKLAYRISCRRRGTEGRGLPEGIKVSGPIKAVLRAPADETSGPDGIIEAIRRVDVELIPSSQAGRRQGEIVFQWADGRTQSHLITWEVRPRVRATPSGIVIRRSKEPLAVTLNVASEDRPIRIIKVDGPLARPFVTPTEPRRVHALRFVVDTSKADRSGISDIEIITDHPEQPSVSVAMLLTASAEGGEP